MKLKDAIKIIILTQIMILFSCGCAWVIFKLFNIYFPVLIVPILMLIMLVSVLIPIIDSD